MDLAKSDNRIEALHGGDVYRNEVKLDFSVNLNPLPMPAEVKAAMLEGLSEINQYPDPSQQKLREKIAEFEGINTESVICGSGASELLMAAVHAVMPKKALIAAPCYAGYEVALRAADTEIEEYCLDESKGFAVDRGIIDRITDQTDMVFIADPNNPNGRLIEPSLKKAIAEKCEECVAVLVIDECFYPLTEEGAGREPVTDNALHLRAFTKTFAIPGIRLGYMLSHDNETLGKIKRHLPEWNVSRIAERTGEAAAEVLLSTDYLSRSVSEISRERDHLTAQLRDMEIKVYDSDVNYLLIKSRPDLYDRLLKKGILIRRCSNFSGLDENYFRIAVRTHADNKKIIRAIKEII